ncbi:MAG: CopG family transcriptional regulator [Anaerolineae bacterium]|jgi:Arc/MetJ-type ribon-helix-helix transcriptional regulator
MEGDRLVTDTEKITINMSVVDLGQVDLLVEQGFYSNRSDLIRTAIRNQLDRHADVLKETVVRKQIVVGVLVCTRSDLEKKQAAGEQLAINVVGMVRIGKDVTPELARDVIQSLHVYGVLRASPEVKDALADRTR